MMSTDSCKLQEPVLLSRFRTGRRSILLAVLGERLALLLAKSGRGHLYLFFESGVEGRLATEAHLGSHFHHRKMIQRRIHQHLLGYLYAGIVEQLRKGLAGVFIQQFAQGPRRNIQRRRYLRLLQLGAAVSSGSLQ